VSGVGSLRPLTATGAEVDRGESLQLVETLRAMRQGARDAAFWERYCAGLTRLCRAQGVMVVQRDATADGWSTVFAQVVPNGPLAAELGEAIEDLAGRAAEQGTAWRPARGGGALAAVAIPQTGAQSLILLELSARERARINELLIRALLVADVPVASEHAVVQPASGGDEWVMLMDIVARVMQEKQFGAAALQLVNLLAATLRCEQVALGWREHGITKVLAISHLDRFEDKTEVIQLLESALEEAADQRVDIDYPQTGEGNTVTLAHERLQSRVGFGSMTTLVMGPDGDEDEPVLTLLLARESRLQERQLHGVLVVCHLLRPWLLEQQERSRWVGRRWLRSGQQLARLAFNPKSPVRNITAGVLVLLLAFVLFGSWPYRIEASGELATDSVQLISAPFDGFLATTSKSLGDPVEEGEVMARLDVRDLQLQIADLQSELQRNLAEADRARALDQIADTAVAQARAEQAAARLDRARFQLSQSEIRAPFAGVVVEGDRKELAGTPVRQGDKLFRMVRSEDLYAVIHVSERDIRDVPENAQWRLRLLGQPNLEIQFEIANIVPVAKVVNGQGNRFTVRVALQSPPESGWRPGMSGLALIDAGSRPIIWIWTHKAIDAVRLWLWW
jgi:RND family efflux transporter MFP subunit